jgi:hypothetical protein
MEPEGNKKKKKNNKLLTVKKEEEIVQGKKRKSLEFNDGEEEKDTYVECVYSMEINFYYSVISFMSFDLSSI